MAIIDSIILEFSSEDSYTNNANYAGQISTWFMMLYVAISGFVTPSIYEGYLNPPKTPQDESNRLVWTQIRIHQPSYYNVKFVMDEQLIARSGLSVISPY